MKCPHCSTAFFDDWKVAAFAKELSSNQHRGCDWSVRHQNCPACNNAVIFLLRRMHENIPNTVATLVYPNRNPRVVPIEVTEPYRSDFLEASAVLSTSEKASAALSRRCLQSVLRDKAATSSKDLVKQIDEVIASQKLPTELEESLHAVRNIGNFGAHPMKSTSTGQIFDVEPGEAEWSLDVLEELFDYYFVRPAAHQKRKDSLNKKLAEAGKPAV